MILLSCKDGTNSNTTHAPGALKNTQDTVIVKHQNELNPSYEAGFLSKSYGYAWVAGKDTPDFKLIVTEHAKDSSLHLHIIHRQPVLFSIALKRVGDCLDLIKDDFYLSKLSSLYFEPPIYYADLSKELSAQYEKTFGRKNVSYKRLNQFLLKTDLNSRLNNFLQPFGKTVSRYGIEKFHLLNKENYSYYLKEVDLTNYPDFTLHGTGISVLLTATP